MINLILSYLLIAIASAADGMLEGYLFDGRKSFERKWGVTPVSFFGSKSWTMTQSLYARLFGVFDFYHIADDLRKYGYIAASACLFFQLDSIAWPMLIWIVLFLGISILMKRISMWWIRK